MVARHGPIQMVLRTPSSLGAVMSASVPVMPSVCRFSPKETHPPAEGGAATNNNDDGATFSTPRVRETGRRS